MRILIDDADTTHTTSTLAWGAWFRATGRANLNHVVNSPDSLPAKQYEMGFRLADADHQKIAAIGRKIMEDNNNQALVSIWPSGFNNSNKIDQLELALNYNSLTYDKESSTFSINFELDTSGGPALLRELSFNFDVPLDRA